MVSQSPRNKAAQDATSPQTPDLRGQRADGGGNDPLEDSQITTVFDGVCGTKSVEVTRAGAGGANTGKDADSTLRPVIRQRDIGYVAEPMC